MMLIKRIQELCQLRYFRLSFVRMYSKVTQTKIEKRWKRFFKNAKVKLVFTSDKLRQVFVHKDSYPSVLSSKVVYEFNCASCNTSYVGQTHRHLTTSIDEHFGKDKKSRIYQHLMSSADCLNICSLNKQNSYQYIISFSIWLSYVSSVFLCYILFYRHTPFRMF